MGGRGGGGGGLRVEKGHHPARPPASPSLHPSPHATPSLHRSPPTLARARLPPSPRTALGWATTQRALPAGNASESKRACRRAPCSAASASVACSGSTAPPTMSSDAAACRRGQCAYHSARPTRFLTVSRRAMVNKMGRASSARVPREVPGVSGPWIMSRMDACSDVRRRSASVYEKKMDASAPGETMLKRGSCTSTPC